MVWFNMVDVYSKESDRDVQKGENWCYKISNNETISERKCVSNKIVKACMNNEGNSIPWEKLASILFPFYGECRKTTSVPSSQS